MGTYLNDNGTLKRIAGGTFYADAPVGTIQAYGGAIDSTHQAPSGWLLCDGSEKNIDDFADLYAVIGDAFGTPSVNTKFVLPDLREATTKGAGLTGKSNNHYDSDGVALGEFIDDRLQDHRHRDVVIANSGTYDAGMSVTTHTSVETDGYDQGVSNLARSGSTTEVKAVGVNYIIKAKQTALPVDLESAVEDAVEEALGGSIVQKTITMTNGYDPNTDGWIVDTFNFPLVKSGERAVLNVQIHSDPSVVHMIKRSSDQKLFFTSAIDANKKVYVSGVIS